MLVLNLFSQFDKVVGLLKEYSYFLFSFIYLFIYITNAP